MTTIKSYTDLQQSKKLAEILPIESADCYWDYDEMQKFHRISWFEDGYSKESQLRSNENNVCAWSLAALLDVLPKNLDIGRPVLTTNYRGYYWVSYFDEYMKETNLTSKIYDNPIDACYEMILNLNEQKLL